ncbi:MAG: MerR family transcriptional regulator [Lachnospiraceae bacterium]|nr:MerR family transcriptional regulator [Lachnospiraceae bacterium]
MDNKVKGLFPITQAAAACGLSRSTLMRMEEKGLLTPAYIAPKSGRRYYDNDNINRILHVQQFQSMGFSPEETASYFTKGGDAAELLAILEEKMSLFQRNVEEMRLRAATNPDMSVQIMTLPETVCCMRRCTGLTIQEKYDAMYDFFHECVENGYVLAREPLFLLHERTDYLEGRISKEPYPLYVCVPVRSESAPENAVRFPSCKALSILGYGDYSRVDEIWLRLGREAKERGLVPAAWPRMLAIVAPYTGREIDPGKYCSRLVMPVAEG